jgi:hypothetical protein
LETIVRYVERDHALVWYGNVQMILSAQTPTPDFMRRIIHELAALSEATRLGTGALLIIRSDVPPPSEEARTFIKHELSRSSMLAAAQIVEGDGFRGAAMRSVLAMLQFTMRPPYSMKIFDNVGSGSIWLASELQKKAGDGPSSHELADAAREVRSRFLTRSLPPPGPGAADSALGKRF